jgi:hypothetical protein
MSFRSFLKSLNMPFDLESRTSRTYAKSQIKSIKNITDYEQLEIKEMYKVFLKDKSYIYVTSSKEGTYCFRSYSDKGEEKTIKLHADYFEFIKTEFNKRAKSGNKRVKSGNKKAKSGVKRHKISTE